ncbi:MAG: hypothetical protein AB8B53_12555 [Flavobacteriales bacterium]
MKKKDFDQFSQKFIANCKTKSSDPFVLKIYSIILKEEENGFGYWDEGHAGDEMLSIFNSERSKESWYNLEKDIKHWTNFQIDLLVNGLVNYNMGYADYFGKRYNPTEFEKQTASIPFKFDLILEIIQLSKSRLRQTDNSGRNNVCSILSEHTWFFSAHFDLLIERDAGNLSKIKKIVHFLKIEEYYRGAEGLSILTKIKNLKDNSRL